MGKIGNWGNFNPRSREGSDERIPFTRFRMIYFNPRSREGSDSGERCSARIWSKFQSTLPRGERRAPKVAFSGPPLFQSTLPRGERRCSCSSSLSKCIISIHAPARGATPCSVTYTYRAFDFNPRSREGSDIFTSISAAKEEDFNPRSREGSDDDAEHILIEYRISIHAPARGATQIRLRQHGHIADFNPRSREGSDSDDLAKDTSNDNFNPRSREGSDFNFI